MTLPEAEFDWSYARAGGPGGQNVNKVSTKAVLRWNLDATASLAPHVKARIRKLFPSRVTNDGFVVIASQEYRDQARNRDACRERLEEMIRVASTLPKPRVKSKPSKASKQRRLTAKKQNAERREQRRVDSDD